MTSKVLLLSLILFLSMAFWNQQYVHTNAAQPPLARTGAPGELTCAASGCHGGAPNTGSGSVSIFFAGAGAGTSYYPDSTYVIGVIVNTGNRHGFEMVALNSSNQSVGTFIGNTPNNTGTASTGGKQYIFHKSIPNPNGGNFTMQWTAPSTNQGPITFYVAGNAANGNATATGDLIYTNTLQIQPLSVGIEDAVKNNETFSLYPNPLTGNQIETAYTLSSSQNVQISLYNINGQLIETLFNQQQSAGIHHQQLTLNRNQYPEGLYLLRLQTETGITQTQKLWVNER